MVAVPLRAEQSAEALRGAIGAVETFAVAGAVYAVAGRIDDLDVGPWDVFAIVAALLLVVALQALLPPLMRSKLEHLRPLDRSAEEQPPKRLPWFWVLAIGGGTGLGGAGLVLDIQLETLAVFVAIGLGSALGGPAYDAWTVARYEREHGRTVYRVEDPPGTEAGLAWLPRAGE